MHLTTITASARRLPSSYHNMPKQYIDRHTTFLTKRTARLPQYVQKIFHKNKYPYYDQWRPWQREFNQLNTAFRRPPKIFVEPIKDWPYFRGDRVEVMVGPDKGKQGLVDYIVRERNWLFITGVNLEHTYQYRSESKLGILVPREKPLLANREAKLVDPSDLLPTDIEWRYDDDGNRVRVSKRTERVIPIPEQAYETIDYLKRDKYREQPKDTPASEAAKVTYKPESKTFEMDICEQMNIKDDRVPYPMYWY